MHEQYHKWYSQYLNRDMEMLVFGKSGTPFILFPTEHGRYFDAKDFGLIDSVYNFIDEGKIKIYCPDSFDLYSWYNKEITASDRVKQHVNYEQSILKDVIEFAKYEGVTDTVKLGGCSFGAYHAVNLALKHPDIVSGIISICGFFDIKRFLESFYNDDCYFNNPFDYLPNLTDEWYLRRIKEMNIIIGTGEWDMFIDESVKICQILKSIGVNSFLDVRANSGHDWNWWKEMFPEYLSKMLE